MDPEVPPALVVLVDPVDLFRLVVLVGPVDLFRLVVLVVPVGPEVPVVPVGRLDSSQAVPNSAYTVGSHRRS